MEAVISSRAAACSVAQDDKLVNADEPAIGGSEDFALLLNHVPGNFTFIGNGDSAGLHNPSYDFNDEAIPHGVAYFVALAQARLMGKGEEM